MPRRPRGHEDSALTRITNELVPSPIKVTLNGASRELPARISVAELVVLLEVRGRYAVEVNGEIVPRSAHAGRRLDTGDCIEVVAAIGGG